MNPFLAHFGGGNSLFSGIILVLAGMLIELANAERKIFQWLSRVCIVTGVVGIVGATIPQPWWILTAWSIFFLTWRLVYNSDRIQTTRWANWARTGFLICTLLVLAMEIPYVFNPPSPDRTPESVLIIGDSLTAGTFRLDERKRWPAKLRRLGGFKVVTMAQPGWRTAEALRTLKETSIPDSIDVIVVLIGGNDVMLDTPVDRYRSSLDGLFQITGNHPAPVYAFEIPLPPLAYRYGQAMRTMADRHDVRLIPRHQLMSVMTGQRNTLDGIHLSEHGHSKLAVITGEILRVEDQ